VGKPANSSCNAWAGARERARSGALSRAAGYAAVAAEGASLLVGDRGRFRAEALSAALEAASKRPGASLAATSNESIAEHMAAEPAAGM
jgi:hypothetical protein